MKAKPTKKQLFLTSYAKTFGHISDTCKQIKINRASYYEWIKADKDFQKAINDIDNSFIDLAESALKKNIDTGMQKAIEFFLCNKKKDTYSNTVRNQLTGANGEPLSVILREIVYREPDETIKKDTGNAETVDI